VDDFGIKHKEKNINVLEKALKDRHAITVDMSGSLFYGASLEWRHDMGELRFSMPGHVPKLLKKVCHQMLTKSQHSPHPAPTITCGSKLQKAIKDSDSLILDKVIAGVAL